MTLRREYPFFHLSIDAFGISVSRTVPVESPGRRQAVHPLEWTQPALRRRTAYCYKCLDVPRSVCVLVCLVMTVSPAKTAEPIEMPLSRWERLEWRDSCIRWVHYGRHLANTIERYVQCGDAGCHYIITVATCFKARLLI